MEDNYNQPVYQVPTRVNVAPTFTEDDHSPLHWVCVNAPVSSSDFYE